MASLSAHVQRYGALASPSHMINAQDAIEKFTDKKKKNMIQKKQVSRIRAKLKTVNQKKILE